MTEGIVIDAAEESVIEGSDDCVGIRLLTNDERRQSSCTHGEVQREVCAHGPAVEKRAERGDKHEPGLM